MVILLDATPLGLITNPRMSGAALHCSQWLTAHLAHGARVIIPEIADYEVRRELLRAGKTHGLARLDQLQTVLEYAPLTTAAMRQAAVFWAQARQQGQPTAPAAALDGDVILAAQAATFDAAGDTVIIATANVTHLARFTVARDWPEILPPPA
ncbi:MAG: nuclease [Actinomycetota bacterium]|jgi:predicted nucleic acid-binding protein|nr:nuclease [Actinomycetota bacterium]